MSQQEVRLTAMSVLWKPAVRDFHSMRTNVGLVAVSFFTIVWMGTAQWGPEE